MSETPPSRESRRAFASRLRPLALQDTRAALEGHDPLFISAFVSRQRECVSGFVTTVTCLIVIVQGRKHVRSGAKERIYEAGEAFVLTAGSRVDVINEPDEAGGTYRALFLCFSRELVIKAARLWPEFVGRSDNEVGVVPEPALCDAILHAGAALTSESRRVVEHRLLEVMLILAEQGALRFTPKYVEKSAGEAVRLLVRHKLDQDWSMASIAASFAMSEATLRRRLRREGLSLRDLLLTERMQAARILLCDRHADVAETLAATGYASRSHFARHFRRTFGVSPAAARAGSALRPQA